MSVIYLKVKIKSLAAEAKIIREQEQKYVHIDQLRNGLTEHRKGVVRYEQRATLLAYGFLRGRSYKQVEPLGKEVYGLYAKVKSMATKYSPNADKGSVEYRLKKWFEEGNNV